MNITDSDSDSVDHNKCPTGDPGPQALACGPAIEINRSKLSATIRDECTCTVCYDLFIEPVTLLCGHSFCRMCINKIREKKTDCPICSKSFGLDELNKNYILENILHKIGGKAYKKQMKKNLYEKKFITLCHKYDGSERYRTLAEKFGNFIIDNSYSTYDDIIIAFPDYDELEILYILHNLYTHQARFIIIKDTIIDDGAEDDYAYAYAIKKYIESVPGVSAEDCLSIVCRYIMDDDLLDLIDFIDKCFPNTSPLYKKITKLSTKTKHKMMKCFKQYI